VKGVTRIGGRTLGIALAIATLAAARALALDPPTRNPYFTSKGSWGQPYDDMWAFHEIGLTSGSDSAWRLLPGKLEPVTIAVIDTGLDWDHLDISWDNIWRNPRAQGDKVPAREGYEDDLIGWDFVAGNNHPWDYDGHGTFVTGLIAATWNSGVGVPGVNPDARIMVLKALNAFGNTRASYIAQAIAYASDNGARVINISVGGKELSTVEQTAVKYASDKGVLIVIAAGNDGVELKNYGLAGLPGVITVGASDHNDKRAVFSNWGRAVDIVAPGLDILSLRARYTDTLRDIPGAAYTAEAAYVGADKRYYVAGGTSFAAPLVTGVASLLFAKDPTLTAAEVKRILLNSAKDVDGKGVNQFTGYGLLDARTALSADRNFFVTAEVGGVSVVNDPKGPLVEIQGTADADAFAGADVELGAGEAPTAFNQVLTVTGPVQSAALGRIPASAFASSQVWIVRLVVHHKNGRIREARFRLQLG
jgi:subtilisin family serine protease